MQYIENISLDCQAKPSTSRNSYHSKNEDNCQSYDRKTEEEKENLGWKSITMPENDGKVFFRSNSFLISQQFFEKGFQVYYALDQQENFKIILHSF